MTEIHIERLHSYHSFVFELAASFINTPLHKMNQEIMTAMETIGLRANVERVYLYEYDEENTLAINTHEWCAPNVASRIQVARAVPMQMIEEVIECHRSGRVFHIDNVQQLQESELKNYLLQHNVFTLVAIPLLVDGKCLGTIGFESAQSTRQWTMAEFELLKLFSHLLTNVKVRQQTETALLESKNYNDVLFHHSHVPSVVIDLEHYRILECNDAAIKIYGLDSKEQALHQSIFMFSADIQYDGRQSKEASNEYIQKALREESAFFEWKHIRPNGESWDAEVHLIAFKHQNRQLLKYTLFDITERIRREQLLEVRLRIAEFATNHTLDQLLQKTLDEIEQITESQIGFFHFLNEDQVTLELQMWSTNTIGSMCATEGRKAHYNIGEAGIWVECIHQRQPVVHNDYDSVPHKKGLPDGHAPIVRQLVAPVIRGNQIVAIIGVGNKPRDYTSRDVELVSALADLAWETAARKRAEEEMKALRDQALLATKAKSDFLAMMSHEIRTPMNVIIGMADLLAETPLKKEQKRYIDVFRRSGEDLLNIINDILDISKFEAGRLTIERIPFNLSRLIQDVSDLYMHQAIQKEIQYSSHIHIAEGFFAVGDPTRIRQIIGNLLSNAVKFTESGSIRLIADCLMEDDGHLCLICRIEDSGIGIATEKLQEIFEPFSQAESFITRRFGGTGLGLAIARQLALLMQGDIAVVSEAGKGSTFVLEVRIDAYDSEKDYITNLSHGKHKKSIETNNGKPLKILIAEDSIDNQLLMKAYLKNQNIKVEFVDNGRLAVESYQNNEYDLVIMDIQMPEMDGYTATSEIRKWEQVNQRNATPVIALTAFALQGDRELAMQAGCTEYMTKPIKKQKIVELLKRYRGEENEDTNH
ncbi:hypothetical protein BHU72_04725 [Desulfuribacillus stibiiarsenatis]|uniref:Circadian input-output histidine kinase CikA n=1 Tax=Desulfuribacillus stibiiarsenatis TaxID=1390249 RepID=A0A1E5L5H9_9FIRM|nr:GAF domain-containing protein [Desulfuribacillus stibiiarsenatis]OEH85397.1 hypothetical protein BHU72_04725 [Desulfuribacillus stibiiarsenatis]